MERWIVIPGFMKAGSTSVFSWLDEAFPSTVERPKEPRFFLRDETGRAELDRYWLESSGGSGTAIDGSVAYLSPEVSTSVAARISAATAAGPAPVFIVMVRDPVARAVSHIRHDVRRGRLDAVDEAHAAALIEPGQVYFERSRLATSIRPFVETFPPENILFIGADVSDARKLAAIASFLGLRKPWPVGGADRKNRTSVQRSFTPALAWIVDHGLLTRAERLVPRRVRPLAAKALLRAPVDELDEKKVKQLMSAESLATLEGEMEQFESITAKCRRPL